MRRGIRLLPQSLSEALGALREDAVVQAGLREIATEFLDLKAREWQTYDRQVTPWEVET